MAMILDQREDMAALRRLLDARFQNPQSDMSVGSFLIDAGQLDRARRAVASFPRLHYQGQLELAEGRVTEAIRTLDLAMSRPNALGDHNQFRVARKLAQALQRAGHIDRAIQVLETASNARSEAAAGPSTGFEWLRVREQLANLYRQVGRIEDARAVESELLTLLAVADDDHPIKRRLTNR